MIVYTSLLQTKLKCGIPLHGNAVGPKILYRLSNKRIQKVEEKSIKNSYIQNHNLKIRSRLWGPRKYLCACPHVLCPTQLLLSEQWTGQIFGVVLHKMCYQITFSSGEANKKFTKVNLSIKVDLYNFHYINPCMHWTEKVKTSTKTKSRIIAP